VALDTEDRLRPSGDSILTVEVTREGTTSTIALAGECDLSQQERFRTAIREALAARPECVLLDLSHLSFIDSTGIIVVIELGRSAQRDGVHLVICPGARQVQRVFDLCGLTSQLPFLPVAGPDGRAA
jgi:anti-anti-sigma factor